MFERLMNQINLMKEIVADNCGVHHAPDYFEHLEKELIHHCYETFDKGYLDVCQLRTLLDRI